jgi:hypothetical protein
MGDWVSAINTAKEKPIVFITLSIQRYELQSNKWVCEGKNAKRTGGKKMLKGRWMDE